MRRVCRRTSPSLANQVIHFDSEFFDRHGIDQFMSFYDDISESENSLHTALRAAIDLSTRLVMIYKRSPHLVVCVLGFSFFQRFVEKRLNAVRDCLTGCGFQACDDTSSNQAVGANLDLETVLGNVRTVRYGCPVLRWCLCSARL